MSDATTSETGQRAEAVDFFISRRGVELDIAAARTLCAHLNELGYTYVIQDEAFRASGSWVAHVEEAFERARRVIAILSPDCMASPGTMSEWRSAVGLDPTGEKGYLIPVMFRPTVVPKFYDQRIYVDLTDPALTEAERRDRLRFHLGAERPFADPAAFPFDLSGPRVETNIADFTTPYFTGRDEELGAIGAALEAGEGAAITQAAVHGMGAVGKSSLAREFARRHAEAYAGVWWLDCARPEGSDPHDTNPPPGLINNLAALAERLNSKLKAEADRTVVAKRALEYLETDTRPWLLIYDNVEKPGDLKGWRPTKGGARLLVASRFNTGWTGQGVTPIEIAVMEPDAAAALLQAASGLEDAAGAAKLAEALGYLPLALAQAGDTIRENRAAFDFARYLAAFDSLVDDAVALDDPSFDPKKTVARTFALAIDRVAARAPAAPAIMNLLAWLAPEAAPIELIAHAADYAPEDQREGLATALTGDVALGALERHALIRRGRDELGETLSVHRVVQAVVRARLSDPAAWFGAAGAALSAACPAEWRLPATWPAYDRLIPHGLALAGHLDGGAAAGLDLESERWALLISALTLTALGAENRASWISAETLNKTALATAERTLGPEHPLTLTSVNNLAAFLFERGRGDEAAPLMRRAVEGRRRVLGPEHPQTKSAERWLARMEAAAAEDASPPGDPSPAAQDDSASSQGGLPEAAKPLKDLGPEEAPDASPPRGPSAPPRDDRGWKAGAFFAALIAALIAAAGYAFLG